MGHKNPTQSKRKRTGKKRLKGMARNMYTIHSVTVIHTDSLYCISRTSPCVLVCIHVCILWRYSYVIGYLLYCINWRYRQNIQYFICPITAKITVSACTKAITNKTPQLKKKGGKKKEKRITSTHKCVCTSSLLRTKQIMKRERETEIEKFCLCELK